MMTCVHAPYAICVIWAFAMMGCSKPSPSEPVTSLPQYHGQTREAVESRLGKPVQEDRFPMSAVLGEMREPLLRTYPLSEPENADVMIEELWWKDGEYWTTLWFHQVNSQWIVLESCRWHEDVLF